MVKATEPSRLLAVVVLVLLTMGVLGYFIPRFAQVVNGERIDWGILSQNTPVILSSFEEQSFLQQTYADEVQRDIVKTLERIAGIGTVQATVRVQLDLEKEQNSKTKMLKETYSEDVIHRTAGVVKKMSVSVLVDGQMEKSKNGRMVYQPRTKDEMKKFETIVKGIVGYQASRGDKVEVLNMPFENHKVSLWGTSISVWVNGALLLLSLFLIVGLIFPVLQSLTRCQNQSRPKCDLLKKASSLCRQDIYRAVAIFKNALCLSQTRKNPRVYTPSEQSAIVLLSLGNFLLKEIFAHFSEEEVRRYGQIMARLGYVAASDIRKALEKFIRQFYTPSLLIGSPERIKEVLTATRADGKNLYSEIYLTADGKDIWERLSGLDKGTISSFLKEQKPETMAMILYHLPEKLSGQLLMLLPKEVSSRVLIHLTHIPYIRPDVREKLTGEIASEVCRLLEFPRQVDKAETILKTLRRKERDTLVDVIAKKDEATAHKMASGLKNWADILVLPENKIKSLLKYSDKNVLAMALIESAPEEQMIFARLLPPALWEQIVNLMQNYTVQNKQMARDIIVRTARELDLF